MELQVRRSPDHIIIAHLGQSRNGVVLEKVTPHSGSLPAWEDLQGARFPDQKAVRQALISRMRAMARDEPQITTLDKVTLSHEAYKRWLDLTEEAAQSLPPGIDSESIPDEQAEPMPDGTLRIHLKVPGMAKIEDFVPAGEWAWRAH